MASKRIRIRLYRVQDYDLLTLYYDKSFGLRRKMEEALVSFANGRPLPSYSLKGVTLLPKPELMDDGIKSKTGTKFVIATTISLPESERAAIELISSLASGDLVNNFVKSIIRRCLVDLECIYIDETLQERYSDPGNAVSSKNIVVHEIVTPGPEKPRKEKPARKPAVEKDNTVENRENPPANGSESSTVKSNEEKIEGTVKRQETTPQKQEQKNRSAPEPSSNKPVGSAFDLFSFADSFNY